LQRIVILANGELPNLHKARALLQEGDFILCADGGTRHAFALDLQPNLVIGDLDSTDSVSLQTLQARGIPIERHPRDKDETDLELALRKAVELAPSEILILAALGGRLDQTLANIALLSDARLSPFNVRLDDGVEEIFFCRRRSQVQGRSGDIVSLFPWGGAASGIHTENLKWPLKGETLYPEKTRGISNEMTSDTAAVSLRAGLLLLIHRRQS
jgi:thiamine pyrophosphokinase